ncbi:MAG: NAD-dependent deacylase [Candidatus Sericytochromatia bacterium]
MENFSTNLINKLKNANSVTVLTGAGVSAESGVPTFRDKDGLWNKFSPQDLANMNSFLKNTELVWEWYKWRKNLISNVSPNAGHYALSEMEEYYTNKGKKFTLITQNVDDLHKKSGSKNILELHGNIMRSRCIKCNYSTENMDNEKTIPTCIQCGNYLRPDVVWFGESLSEEILDKAFEEAENCDVFFSIGTSSLVYPAAMLPVHARDEDAYIVEINPERSALAYLFDEEINKKSGEILPEIMQELKK